MLGGRPCGVCSVNEDASEIPAGLFAAWTQPFYKPKVYRRYDCSGRIVSLGGRLTTP